MRRLALEFLDPRDCPAVLDVTGGVLMFTDGGSEANVVTFVVSGPTYTVNDTSGPITFGAGMAGWVGNGTSTARGPVTSFMSAVLDLGDGDDILNIRATGKPLTVMTGDGNDTVNISSNSPANTGVLDLVTAAVLIDGDSDDVLILSDKGSTGGNAAVVIDGAALPGETTISGMAPAVITAVGTFGQIRVIGSNNAGVAEGFTIRNPNATAFFLDTHSGDDTVVVESGSGLLIDTGAGNDSVSVVGDAAGVISLGTGDDYLYVASGVTWTGDVYGGVGSDTFDIDGSVTGSVVP